MSNLENCSAANPRFVMAQRTEPFCPEATPDSGPLSGELRAPQSGEFAPLSGNPEGVSGNLERLSGNPGAATQEFAALVGDVPGLVQEFALLPAEVQRRVLALKPRTGKVVTRSLLVSLCSIRAWRADELALLLRRATNYLQENYLKQMVGDGSLQRTQPQTPNHPQQAYYAPQNEETP